MKLGIFDSGIGGKAVAAELAKTFPQAIIVTVNDHENVPYGSKSPEEILRLTENAIQPFLEAGDFDVIILACNTASAIALQSLRDQYPHQKFIGIEPMIKTAASLTKNRIVAVCATPATLASDRYRNLITRFGAHLTIIEPDCSRWAYMIENNRLNNQEIADIVNDICKQGADVIVLGCTHYHWIKDLIVEMADGRAVIIEPSEAIGRRVVHLIDSQLSD